MRGLGARNTALAALDTFRGEADLARVPDEELERLKRGISLERLVTARGVELHKRGDSLVGRCPFHEDSVPPPDSLPAE